MANGSGLSFDPDHTPPSPLFLHNTSPQIINSFHPQFFSNNYPSPPHPHPSSRKCVKFEPVLLSSPPSSAAAAAASSMEFESSINNNRSSPSPTTIQFPVNLLNSTCTTSSTTSSTIIHDQKKHHVMDEMDFFPRNNEYTAVAGGAGSCSKVADCSDLKDRTVSTELDFNVNVSFAFVGVRVRYSFGIGVIYKYLCGIKSCRCRLVCIFLQEILVVINQWWTMEFRLILMRKELKRR